MLELKRKEQRDAAKPRRLGQDLALDVRTKLGFACLSIGLVLLGRAPQAIILYLRTILLYFSYKYDIVGRVLRWRC